MVDRGIDLSTILVISLTSVKQVRPRVCFKRGWPFGLVGRPEKDCVHRNRHHKSGQDEDPDPAAFVSLFQCPTAVCVCVIGNDKGGEDKQQFQHCGHSTFQGIIFIIRPVLLIWLCTVTFMSASG